MAIVEIDRMRKTKASFLADSAFATKQKLEREICGCGHHRIVHGSTVMGLAVGHGKCFVHRCPCVKFTWHHEDESRVSSR